MTGAGPGARPRPVACSPRVAVSGGHAGTSAQDARVRHAAEGGDDLDELVEHFELEIDVIQARLAQLGLEIGEPTFGFE